MFYEYKQNNSGGSFDVDDKLCNRLFIEADSAKIANRIAEGLGCYWNGVDAGLDCECCGDRWTPRSEGDWRCVNLDKVNEWYGVNTIEEYAQYLADKYGMTIPDARIYYANGTVKEIFKN